MMTVVSIVQDRNAEFAIQSAIHLLGGIESFVKSGDRVVIKPNLVFGVPPFTGFTTDPPIIQAIIRLCKSMNPSEIIIAEGSGGFDTKLAFRMSGYVELAELHGVKLVDLNESSTEKVVVPKGHTVQELHVPKIILDCDVLINVPKLKLYKRVSGKPDWLSLAVKNLLGALPAKGEYSQNRESGFSIELSPEFWTTEGRYFHPAYQRWWSPRGEKKRIHKNLAQGLVDVNLVVQPTLNLIDGIIVSTDIDMTLAKGEKTFELNTILASRDPLALDCIAARIGGINAIDITYLRKAAERGIGELDFNRIQVLGTKLERIMEAWEMYFGKK